MAEHDAGDFVLPCHGCSMMTFDACVITPLPIGQRSIAMSVSVCLSVCLCLPVRDHNFGTARPISVHVTYCRGSVLLQRRSDTFCTSGFVDDVIIVHMPRWLIDVAAQLKRSAHAAFGLTISCAH